MDLRKYLDDCGVDYAWRHHEPTFTAQQLAQHEHISGKRVVKPVLVETDGRFVLCALPASCFVDVERLRDELGADSARLADEAELQKIFLDCETGAEPPVGRIFGIRTVIDEAVMHQKTVVFQAGTHEDAVEMTLADYVRLTQPIVREFGKPRA